MTPFPLVIRGAADLADRRILVGGKAANLARALDAGHAVPPFFVVTAEAFQQVVRANLAAQYDQLIRTVETAGTAAIPSAAATLRAAILDVALPLGLVAQIRDIHNATFGAEPAAPLAVRSSSVAEDGGRHSFAGMHDSELGVVGVESVVDAIKLIWASAFSDRAMAYRRKWRRPVEPAPMAVIVQRLIAAQWSGVLFTRDPADCHAERVLINATPGLGDALVQGRATAKTSRVDRGTLAIESTSPSTDNDEHVREWPPATQLREVAAAGLALEETMGEPQDVEFCFGTDGQLAILQTRPITATAPAPHRSASHVIWDNSNIIESYPGVTGPMTFSFIRRAYSIVYRCFSEVMGIPPQAVRENQDAFDNMLGLFHGRVYYNLTNWHRLVQLFPGYRYNREFMESMMGVKEAAPLIDRPRPPGFWRRWLVELPALVGLVRRSAWNFWRIRSLVDRFDEEFERRYSEWSQIDFAALAPDEIMALYGEMETEMFAKWKTPIINDFFVMVFYGLLRKLCAAWCGDESGSLQNGLLCGDGGVESAEPVRQLLQLVSMAKGQPALKHLILAGPVEGLPQRIANDSSFAAFSQSLDAYLARFGLRCVEELKLESRTYRDHPHLVYQLLQNYLSADACTWPEAGDRRERELGIRTENEQQALRLMAQSGSGPAKRRLFRWVLENTRLGVRNREKMRLARTRIFDVFRSMLRSIGNTFEREGILDSPHDIFYLTINEMWGYIKGAAATTDLRSLVALRRQHYAAYGDAMASPPPRRFETCGLPYGSSAAESDSRPSGEPGTGQLRGVGGCPGVVTGMVEVVRHPREAQFAGDIMVAEQTDPGWTSLYPAYSGLLIERGSVLSHSIIVAREFGIPTIVGVDGLTRGLRSGDRVRMDGRTGSIEILPNQTDDDPGTPGQRQPSAAVTA